MNGKEYLHDLQVTERTPENSSNLGELLVFPSFSFHPPPLFLGGIASQIVVRWEHYPSVTPAGAVADIQQATHFTVFDALKGYHQCPLVRC